MQRKQTGLEGTTELYKGTGRALRVQGILKPQDCGRSVASAPHPGWGRVPSCLGTRARSASGQKGLASFWPQLAPEECLLVSLSLSTGCHCSECRSL